MFIMLLGRFDALMLYLCSLINSDLGGPAVPVGTQLQECMVEWPGIRILGQLFKKQFRRSCEIILPFSRVLVGESVLVC